MSGKKRGREAGKERRERGKERRERGREQKRREGGSERGRERGRERVKGGKQGGKEEGRAGEIEGKRKGGGFTPTTHSKHIHFKQLSFHLLITFTVNMYITHRMLKYNFHHMNSKYPSVRDLLWPSRSPLPHLSPSISLEPHDPNCQQLEVHGGRLCLVWSESFPFSYSSAPNPFSGAQPPVRWALPYAGLDASCQVCSRSLFQDTPNL